MIMHKLDENVPGAFTPGPEMIDAVDRFLREATDAGVLLSGEGLRPSSMDAKRITVRDGKTTVTDGPFAETKELIAGFVLIQVDGLAEATEWGHRYARLFGDIEIDIRRVTEAADLA
ncbi:YciI family protein [Amycolatopsis nigrescens]|uniref:YciI family protein n=1 Tax=Amycolatopsis nigrescens TaxID=381445 RepID=UPI001B7FED10|nr:YciI family protein [Amycolatopsis nigrescens]